MNTISVSIPPAQTFKASSDKRLSDWISGALVAALLISLISVAWWRSTGTEPENIAWAPLTPSMHGMAPLDPSSAPWITDFSPEDCTETSGLSQVEIDFSVMPAAAPQKYAVTGAADKASAQKAAQQYRNMRGCNNLASAWAYWTEARINWQQRTITDATLLELEQLQSYFATVYPQQFMAVGTDLEVDPTIASEWQARADMGVVGQPIPLAAKLNPEWGVSLADGRIAFPATIMYAANDPAIVLNGMPEEHPASTVAIIMENVDGTWKYDDSLALCLVENCPGGIGDPIDPTAHNWVQPAELRGCEAPSPVQDINYGLAGQMPEFRDRAYQVVGPAHASDAAAITNNWYACGWANDDSAQYAMTELGLINLLMVEQGAYGNPFAIAPYLRQRELGTSEILTSVPGWTNIAVVNTPLRTQRFGMAWNPAISGQNENTATVFTQDGAFDPETVMELSDGRMAIGYTKIVSINDRGAITYEGNVGSTNKIGVVLQHHEDTWVVDELLEAPNGVLLATQSDGWWWDPSFDDPVATAVASPKP